MPRKHRDPEKPLCGLPEEQRPRRDHLAPDLESFFLLKEKDPTLLVQISADLRAIRSCQVLTKTDKDASGIAYDGGRRLLWIVSDESERLYLYDGVHARRVKKYKLGFPNAEGVALDPRGEKLWIVSDRGGGKDSRLYSYRLR